MTLIEGAPTTGADAPTAAELVDRIRALHPLISGNAAQGEQDRRVPDETVDALAAAGVFRVSQPRRYGGSEAGVRAMLEVSAAVGEADGGAAWITALMNVNSWVLGLFPEAAQDDVWRDDPDARLSGVLSPTAHAEQVDGGFRITGKWFWNSGSYHTSWALLGFPILNAEGQLVDQRVALIPRADLGWEDTWFVAGMRASGSNALIADDVFVPEHRTLSVLAGIGGTYATERTDEAFYRSALVPVLAIVLAGPQLGLGRAALELVRTKGATKSIAYTMFTQAADSTAFQLQLAEAAMLIDTAHLHAFRTADGIDDHATAGTYPDLLERARMRADTGWSVEHVQKAIQVLLSAYGASSFAESNPIQRMWRDLSVASRHAVVLPVVGYEVYGKALLGRQDQITPLI